MEQFRTILSRRKDSFQLVYSDRIMLSGSCFAEHMATKLQERKFSVLSNPYGILFNPISLFQSFQEIINQRIYKEQDLVFHDELEHSMNHHSRFSGTNPTKVVGEINRQIQGARDFLQDAKVLFLTLGTAWVYRYDGSIVANCHKIPNHQFEKELLDIHTIVDSFYTMYDQLKIFNPNLQVVFTLSPVRHIKDGIEENSVSKAILRTAIHQLSQENKQVNYFPAYELLMDDLRDYRFYNADMLHPNEQAIDYVWAYFKDCYFASETQDIIQRVEKLEAAINHKPRFPESDAYQKHLAFIEKEKKALGGYYDFLKWQ